MCIVFVNVFMKNDSAFLLFCGIDFRVAKLSLMELSKLSCVCAVIKEVQHFKRFFFFFFVGFSLSPAPVAQNFVGSGAGLFL